jgi:hypothetical protein
LRWPAEARDIGWRQAAAKSDDRCRKRC